MRSSSILGIVLLAVSGPVISAQNDISIEQARMLCTSGDFERAIDMFDRIVREGSSALAAQALNDRATCSVKRGEAAARTAYERTIREYADQPDVVADARGRLSALPVPPGRPAVYTVNIDPGTGTVRGPVTRVTQAANATEQYPTWSPDGKSIAYRRGPTARDSASIVVRSLASGEEQSFDGTRESVGASLWLRTGGLLSIPGPANSRAQDLINVATSRGDLELLISAATAAAAQGDATAQDVLHLTTGTTGTRQPSTAPRGAKPTAVTGDIYRNDLKGAPQKLGSFGFAVRPANVALAQSHERLYAYVVSGDRSLMAEAIAVFDLSAGRPAGGFALSADVAPLARNIPAGGRLIAVSPDGRRLAIARRPGEFNAYIVVCGVEAEGKDCKTLVSNTGPLLALTWTTDNSAIIYAKSLYGVPAGEVNRIMRVPADGGTPTFTGLEVRGMTFFDLNPDGTRLAFDGIAYSTSAPDNAKGGGPGTTGGGK
jgi:hypothetical protein